MPTFTELAKKYADEKAEIGPQKDPNLHDYTEKDESFLGSTRPDNIDKALLIAKLLATGIDTAQTRYVARNPDKYYEDTSSWAIGHHPHQDKVAAYMLGQMAADALVYNYAPSAIKKGWLGMRFGADTAPAIVNNKKIGIKARM